MAISSKVLDSLGLETTDLTTLQAAELGGEGTLHFSALENLDLNSVDVAAALRGAGLENFLPEGVTKQDATAQQLAEAREMQKKDTIEGVLYAVEDSATEQQQAAIRVRLAGLLADSVADAFDDNDNDGVEPDPGANDIEPEDIMIGTVLQKIGLTREDFLVAQDSRLGKGSITLPALEGIDCSGISVEGILRASALADFLPEGVTEDQATEVALAAAYEDQKRVRLEDLLTALSDAPNLLKRQAMALAFITEYNSALNDVIALERDD